MRACEGETLRTRREAGRQLYRFYTVYGLKNLISSATLSVFGGGLIAQETIAFQRITHLTKRLSSVSFLDNHILIKKKV